MTYLKVQQVAKKIIVKLAQANANDEDATIQDAGEGIVINDMPADELEKKVKDNLSVVYKMLSSYLKSKDNYPDELNRLNNDFLNLYTEYKNYMLDFQNFDFADKNQRKKIGKFYDKISQFSYNKIKPFFENVDEIVSSKQQNQQSQKTTQPDNRLFFSPLNKDKISQWLKNQGWSNAIIQDIQRTYSMSPTKVNLIIREVPSNRGGIPANLRSIIQVEGKPGDKTLNDDMTNYVTSKYLTQMFRALSNNSQGGVLGTLGQGTEIIVNLL